MSTSGVPNSSATSAIVRTCSALVKPFGIRRRIMNWPGVCRRKNTPAHFSRSRSSFADRLPAALRERRDVGNDVEAVLLLLDALDLVQRDDDLVVLGAARGASIGGVGGGDVSNSGSSTLRQAMSMIRCDLGTARAAAGAGARPLADRLQAARAAQHRVDDLRLRHGVAVADLRVVGHLLGRAHAASRSAAGRAARSAARPAPPSANACATPGTSGPSPIRIAPTSRSLRTISFL